MPVSNTATRRSPPRPWPWLLALLAAASCDAVLDDPRRPVPAEDATNVVVPPTPADPLLGRPDPLDGLDPADTVEKPALQPLRPTPFDRSVPPEPPDVDSTSKASTTMTLEGRVRWPAKDPTPHLAGMTGDELDQGRLGLSRRFSAELDAEGSMRLQLLGGAFPLPRGTSILGRADRYGYLLVWPDREQYRVLPRGSLLNLMRERRVDVAPLVNTPGKTSVLEKERRFGYELERMVVATERGSLTLDSALVPDAGRGGIALCRALLELIAASASATSCGSERVPIKATYRVADHELEFLVESLKVRNDVQSSIRVPPKGARFLTRGLPRSSELIATAELLQALAPGEDTGTLEVVNGGELSAYLTLRDVPIAYLAPKARVRVSGLATGEHLLGLVGFFGEPMRGPEAVTVTDRTRFAHQSPLPDAGPGD